VNVLVDTSVWSLALRRAKGGAPDVAKELSELIREGRVQMMGAVRQELLSGVRDVVQFERLREQLRAFPDVIIETHDWEMAAECFNRCRAAGVQGSNTDFLICAVALRHGMSIFSTDRNFVSFQRVLPFQRHRARD